MNKEILAIDIGGSSIKYALVNNQGLLNVAGSIDIPKTYNQLIKEIVKIDKQINNSKIICISSPCNYYDDKLNGVSFVDYLLNKDIVNDIKTATDKVVYIENDGGCAALGESYNNEYKNIVSIVVGSGIGGGVIINNELIKGWTHRAGNIGAQILDMYNYNDNGLAPSMGRIGGVKILVDKAMGIDDKYSNGKIIFETTNNLELEKIKEEFINAIAIGIINVDNIINPDAFIIGGGLSNSDIFCSQLQNKIIKIIDELEHYPTYPKIKVSMLNNDANLIGAASLFFNSI